MVCPHCRKDAPTITRGVRAYCVACGAPRSLLESTPVNVAGQPAKVGAGLATVFAWLVLAGGLTIAFFLVALLEWVLAAGGIGWVLGGFVAFVSLLISGGLWFGGRRLRKSGDARAKSAHEEALLALAAQQRGVITVDQVSKALSMTQDEADALLTELAKRPDGQVSLEVDDDGNLYYLFRAYAPAMRIGQRAPVRIAPGGPANEANEANERDEAEREALAERELAENERRRVLR